MENLKVEITIDQETDVTTVNLSDGVTMKVIGYSILMLFDYLDFNHRTLLLRDLEKIKKEGLKFCDEVGNEVTEETEEK